MPRPDGRGGGELPPWGFGMFGPVCRQGVFGILVGRQARVTGMSAPTIPISEASHRILRELAEQTGQSMTEVLDKALDAYRRKVFFEQLNAGYAELRADPQAWAEHLAGRKQWDATLLDGLDPEEHWTEDGRSLTPEDGTP